jgi:hypothetical protein
VALSESVAGPVPAGLTREVVARHLPAGTDVALIRRGQAAGGDLHALAALLGQG